MGALSLRAETAKTCMFLRFCGDESLAGASTVYEAAPSRIASNRVKFEQTTIQSLVVLKDLKENTQQIWTD